MKFTLTPKSEATRQRILAAALRVFRERGFDAATMREVAAEAGVAVGAAYYYFDSKDAIVMAFYEQSQQEMAPELEAILQERLKHHTYLVVSGRPWCYGFDVKPFPVIRGIQIAFQGVASRDVIRIGDYQLQCNVVHRDPVA